MPSADSKPYLPVVVKQQPLRGRLLIVVLVVLVHALLLFSWGGMPVTPISAHREMSVSMVTPLAEPHTAPRAATQAAQQVAKSDEPSHVQSATAIAALSAPVEKTATEVLASQPVSSPPGLPDAEPDYKAGYLNNPRPAYPMVARRMGWQGRVVLNVEVLAEGACGAVSVLRSSGHEVLDNAAMNTVKGWRFTPARYAGRIVTQWFKLPIVFSLEDNDT